MTSMHTSDPAAGPLFSAQGLHKRFDGVPVLQGLSLQVRTGEIHALVGENGSGKSTAMNLIAGLLQPDAGEMKLGGRPWQPRTAAQARAGGVAFVQQELNLFEGLSLMDNLHLLQPPPGGGAWPWRRRAHRRRLAADSLAEVGLNQAATTDCRQLSPGERQLLEVAKALAARPRLVIFDEPTTSLSLPERERLFGLIRRLRDQGCGVLYISHVLADVFQLADRLTLLRDGRPVGTLLPGEMQADRVIAAISARRGTATGRAAARPPRTAAPAPAAPASAPPPLAAPWSAGDAAGPVPLLRVRGLTRRGVIHGVDFELQAGEVLGLAGLMGAGRTELARLLFGLDRWDEGEVLLQGLALRPGQVADRLAGGLALLGEDRQREGLMPQASVQANMALAALPRFCRGRLRWLQQRRLAQGTREMADAVALRAVSPGFLQAPVRRLSGGNQQKVLLGRWALRAPRLWILDEPTRGVDVNARADIHRWVREQAAQGAGVLVISSEQDELTELCDRILVLRRGRLAAEFPQAAFEPARILAASMQPQGEAPAGSALSGPPSPGEAAHRPPVAPPKGAPGEAAWGPLQDRLLQRAAAPALAPLWALGLVAVVFGSLSSRFLTLQNLLNIAVQATPLAVLALGMHWVLLAGSIDLSVAAVMYLVGVVLAGSLQHAGPGTAVLAALALGAACGALSGTLVVHLRMAAFMATLALMFVLRALGLWWSDTQGLPVSPALADLARLSWLGMPAVLWLAAAVWALSAGLMAATPLGRWVKAVGEDRDAARRAGVAVGAVVAGTHLLCGLHAALAGTVMMAQVGFVTSAFGEGMEFLAVAAAALGGTRLLGGRGGLAGPVLGALLLQAVQNGLVLSGADPYAYPLVTALCILAAVAVGSRHEAGRAVPPISPAHPIPPSPGAAHDPLAGNKEH